MCAPPRANSRHWGLILWWGKGLSLWKHSSQCLIRLPLLRKRFSGSYKVPVVQCHGPCCTGRSRYLKGEDMGHGRWALRVLWDCWSELTGKRILEHPEPLVSLVFEIIKAKREILSSTSKHLGSLTVCICTSTTGAGTEESLEKCGLFSLSAFRCVTLTEPALQLTCTPTWLSEPWGLNDYLW